MGEVVGHSAFSRNDITSREKVPSGPTGFRAQSKSRKPDSFRKSGCCRVSMACRTARKASIAKGVLVEDNVQD